DGPGREAERGREAEPPDLVAGRDVAGEPVPLLLRILPRSRPLATAVLEQPDRLEEIETERCVEQAPPQTKTLSPSLGAHRRSTPSRPLTVATIFVNELTVQYSPMKCSSTLAKRKRLRPVKRSSSNWRVTSAPRQKAIGPSPWMGATTLR